MNLKRIFFLSLIFLTTHGAEIYASFNFKTTSRLSSGKWVKIEIDATGLYQIPYSQLTEMGFEDPSAVGVYGRGGGLLAVSFKNPSEGVAYRDDIEPVAVIHDNQSLYFYARGTESLSFNPGAASHFTKGVPNLYSRTAYYFLSDCQKPLAASETQCGANAMELTTGWDYAYHERDLTQNTTNTGQLFWGEDFLDGEPLKEWKLSLPFLSAGVSRLAYRLYTSPGAAGEVALNIKGTDDRYSFPFIFTSADRFNIIPSSSSQSPVTFELPCADEISLTIEAKGDDPDFLNLDYWLLSYQKSLPGMSGLKQNASEQYYFPVSPYTYYNVPLNEELRCIDITSPESIKIGKRDEEDQSKVGLQSSSKTLSIIVYDPQRPQRRISGWKTVDNTNLHALQESGAELLIITVPRFRAYADQIAELHRSYEGIAVAVATPEEIYNEFSAGVPDPMAYRAFAKMLYQSKGNQLKNILLLGPSDRNLRNEIAGETKFDRIIAMQQASVAPGRAASPAYDFYGIMDDDVNESILYRKIMEVGVGLLACESDNDCQRAVRKIEEYLADDTQAWRVNETLTVGGLHDNHTHEQQAEDFGNYIRNYSGHGGMAHTTIALDAYGYENARHQFIKSLENGKLFTVYFGHGSSQMLGQDKKFFTNAEALSLKNTHLGFMFMGGCDFSTPDIRNRGLGETIVLDAERGMAGAIVSTRTAWSNQNYDLGKRLMAGWLAPKNMDVSPTIGEIYASSKSASTSMNSMTFILAGDPALKVPSPLRHVTLDIPENAFPGQTIKVKGTITDTKGIPDNSFNGKVVLKLMEPSKRLRSKDYITNTANTPVKITVDGQEQTVYYTLDVTYDTNLMAAVETETEGGVFNTEFVIPQNAGLFTGSNLKLHAGVFDKSRWLGGAGSKSFRVSDTPDPDTRIDMESPVLEARYDNGMQMISVTVDDDTAIPLASSGYKALLDGKPYVLHNTGYTADGNMGRHFEGYADTAVIPDGQHTFSVTATDMAGNSVTTEMSFEKTPRTAPLSLILSTKAAVDEIEIAVEGDLTGSLDYDIRDTTGKTVLSGTMTGSSVTWDCRDSKSVKVKPGLYRIRVRSGAGAANTKYSDWATFAVFD